MLTPTSLAAAFLTLGASLLAWGSSCALARQVHSLNDRTTDRSCGIHNKFLHNADTLSRTKVREVRSVYNRTGWTIQFFRILFGALCRSHSSAGAKSGPSPKQKRTCPRSYDRGTQRNTWSICAHIQRNPRYDCAHGPDECHSAKCKRDHRHAVEYEGYWERQRCERRWRCGSKCRMCM